METFSITSQTDLIGIVPHVLGYPPSDSLVVLTTARAPDGARLLGVCMRLDFDLVTAAAVDRAAASALAASLREADTVECAYSILYSDALAEALGYGSGPAEPGAAEILRTGVERVCDALQAAGIEVSAPVWVGRGLRGMCEGGAAEALPGLSAAVASHMAEQGSRVSEDFGHAAALPEPPAQLLAEVAVLRAASPDALALLAAVLSDAVAVYDVARSAPGSARPVPSAAAVLAFEELTDDLWVRDLLQMVLGFEHPQLGPERLRSMTAEEFTVEIVEAEDRIALAAQMAGLSEVRPDMQLAEAGVDYLRAVAGAVALSALPAVLAMLAWAEWARARHSFAAHYAQAALALDPDYSLAQLMLRASEAGMPPAWMRG